MLSLACVLCPLERRTSVAADAFWCVLETGRGTQDNIIRGLSAATNCMEKVKYESECIYRSKHVMTHMYVTFVRGSIGFLVEKNTDRLVFSSIRTVVYAGRTGVEPR